jgi:hypothetical protein
MAVRTREYGAVPEPPRPPGWAVGGRAFAASMMILIGSFQTFAGIAALVNDKFYVVGPHYAFDLDVTAWGWIHLVIGVGVLVVGVGLLGARAWAGVAAIFLAMISALSNFFFIPYYPWWALLVIALDVWVIWALTRPGAIQT